MAKYVQLQLTEAQARSIIAVLEMDMASGYEDMVQVFGPAAMGAAENGMQRIRKALHRHAADKAAREARAKSYEPVLMWGGGQS